MKKNWFSLASIILILIAFTVQLGALGSHNVISDFIDYFNFERDKIIERIFIISLVAVIIQTWGIVYKKIKKVGYSLDVQILDFILLLFFIASLLYFRNVPAWVDLNIG